MRNSRRERGNLQRSAHLTGGVAGYHNRHVLQHFGHLFRVTTFGESHGPAIGCVVDGCPPNIPLTAADIQRDLDRRRPGQSRFTTQRREPDAVRILSGVFTDEATGQEVTTGTPIALMIENVDQRSKDYAEIMDIYRPGHADYTYDVKYGLHDYRGGGRASARETASAGRRRRDRPQDRAGRDGARRADPDGAAQNRPRRAGTGPRSTTIRSSARTPSRPHSSPTISTMCASAAPRSAPSIEVVAEGVPPGLGAPVYGKLDGDLAAALMGINAVKGVEIGAGFCRSGALRRGECRRDAHGQRRQTALPVEPRRRHSGRHLDRPADRRALCRQADLLDPDPAQDGRPLRQRDRDRQPRAATTPASASVRSRSAKRWWRASSRITICVSAGRSARTWSGRLRRRQGRKRHERSDQTHRLRAHQRVAAVIEAFARGEIVVVADDDDRENEGDLFVAASLCTPEKMAFIIRHTSGIVCAPLASEDARRLRLDPMVSANDAPLGTAFTVSVDFRHGLTTGISAEERTNTVRALANGNTGADRFRSPGPRVSADRARKAAC